MAQAEAKIVEVVYAGGLALVACDIVCGEIKTGMRFFVPGKQGEWRVVATAPVEKSLYLRGRRGITLSLSKDHAELANEDMLIEK